MSIHRLLGFFTAVLCLLVILTAYRQLPGSQPYRNISQPEGFPISNFDASGKAVQYIYRTIPKKVVVTHPGATELLLELGLADHIVSTVAPYGTPLQRLADQYARLPILQAKYLPAREEVIELQPDLLIGWAHHFSDSGFGNVQSWHERDVATYIVPSSLHLAKPTLENSVYVFIADMGKIFGILEKAEQHIRQYQERVARVQEAVRDVPRKKTVLVLQDHMQGNFTLYDSSYLVSNMISIAGGLHIGEQVTSVVGPEEVLAYDPDFILFVSTGAGGKTEAIFHLQGIRELQSMRAIRQGNVISLPFFTVNNGGIRAVDAIEAIAHALYPERV